MYILSFLSYKQKKVLINYQTIIQQSNFNQKFYAMIILTQIKQRTTKEYSLSTVF